MLGSIASGSHDTQAQTQVYGYGASGGDRDREAKHRLEDLYKAYEHDAKSLATETKAAPGEELHRLSPRELLMRIIAAQSANGSWPSTSTVFAFAEAALVHTSGADRDAMTDEGVFIAFNRKRNHFGDVRCVGAASNRIQIITSAVDDGGQQSASVLTQSSRRR